MGAGLVSAQKATTRVAPTQKSLWNFWRESGVYISNVNDTELIAQARQGDNDAWESLTRLHHESVFRLAYLIVGDPADADDVAQETFIRAYRSLDQFDTTRAARPWLLSITTNLARNRLRSVGRYLSALTRLAQPEPKPLSKDDSQLLWQAVRQLNSSDQEIVYLRYFFDMSEAESAETLSLPVGTIKSRSHRVLAKLRAIIERDYPELREMTL